MFGHVKIEKNQREVNDSSSKERQIHSCPVRMTLFLLLSSFLFFFFFFYFLLCLLVRGSGLGRQDDTHTARMDGCMGGWDKMKRGNDISKGNG